MSFLCAEMYFWHLRYQQKNDKLTFTRWSSIFIYRENNWIREERRVMNGKESVGAEGGVPERDVFPLYQPLATRVCLLFAFY